MPCLQTHLLQILQQGFLIQHRDLQGLHPVPYNNKDSHDGVKRPESKKQMPVLLPFHLDDFSCLCIQRLVKYDDYVVQLK